MKRARRLRIRRRAPLQQTSWAAQLAQAIHAEPGDDAVARTWQALIVQLGRTTPAGYVPGSTSDLSAAEAETLARGSEGLRVSPNTTTRVLAESATAWADLLATSMSAAEAAQRLGVQESRVRQRLAEGTLYGFKDEGAWRVPSLQFHRGALLPGLAEVARRIPRTLHPLAVVSWLTAPTPDLALNGHLASPRDWLLTGGDPATAAALAAEL